MRKVIKTRWIGVASVVVALSTVWINMPSGLATAQPGPPLVPVLLSNPVGLNGTVRSTQVVSVPPDRAVLTVTNIGDEVLDVRMGFRDALNFSTVLATTDIVLEPGTGASLPYIEQDNVQRTVVGVVSPAGGLATGHNWNAGPWTPGGRWLLASVSITDGTSNTVKAVLGTSAMPISRAVFDPQARR